MSRLASQRGPQGQHTAGDSGWRKAHPRPHCPFQSCPARLEAASRHGRGQVQTAGDASRSGVDPGGLSRLISYVWNQHPRELAWGEGFRAVTAASVRGGLRGSGGHIHPRTEPGQQKQGPGRHVHGRS